VATGQWYQRVNDLPQNRYQIGFLLDSEGDRVTVLSLGLDKSTFTRTPPDTPEHKRVDYEKLNLKGQVADYLESLRSLRARSKDDQL
jgi:hypothetical protein